jgi:sugar phosphate isomerase/epimerase
VPGHLPHLAGERLIHVHACDNRGTYDDHLPPGMGVIDWGSVVESLRGVGYQGWVILELACFESGGEGLIRIRNTAEAIFAS